MGTPTISSPSNGRQLVPHSSLTHRQTQVLALAALEYTSDEIANIIGRDSKTVESHLNHIYQKFHVRSRLGAVLKAMSLGELPTDNTELIRIEPLVANRRK